RAIGRDQIERAGAVGVADLLARQPGIEITRTGGVGNTTSLYVRGAETRFTAVYIDGVRIDSQSTGGATWESIPLSQIDRIEVLRGPAAAVYGSDAIGGVVQLFTRRGEGGVSPTVGVGFGSHGLRRAEVGVSGTAGTGNVFDYSIGATHEESKGYNIQPWDKRVLTRTAQYSADGFTSGDRDGYRTDSSNVKLGYQFTPNQRIEATVLLSEQRAQYDTAKLVARPPTSYPDDIGYQRLRTAGLAWNAKWSDFYSTRVQVTDSSSNYETQPSYYRTETQLRGYLFQNEFRFGANLVTATLERREDAIYNPPVSLSARVLRRDRSQDALALGYSFVQGPHSLQLHARRDDDSEFGGKTTGSAAYGFAITPQWRVTASVGTAFRVPTLYQRFSEYGVDTLKPESSRNAEVGLRYADGGTAAGIVLYRNRVNNLITFDGSARGCASLFGCYRNTARAVYQGATLTASQNFGDVTLRASADFQDPRDLDTGNLLARRSRQHGIVGADWRVAGWTLGAEVQTSGYRYDDAANKRRLGGYTLLNLSASTKITPQWTFLARIDNVNNKDYELARGYATGGRAGYVSLKWTPL
ncbi:MAG: TonB-dependent receptor, partial [Comamonadaceae bacterium]